MRNEEEMTINEFTTKYSVDLSVKTTQDIEITESKLKYQELQFREPTCNYLITDRKTGKLFMEFRGYREDEVLDAIIKEFNIVLTNN